MRREGRTRTLSVPAYVARTQFGSILKEVADNRVRFVITKNGKPTAVILGARDFDDILEELDPEFRKSLKAVAKQYRAGKAVTLREYLRTRLKAGRAG